MKRIVCMGLVAVMIGCFSLSVYGQPQAAEADEHLTEVLISAAGDCTLGSDPNKNTSFIGVYNQHKNDIGYFFANVQDYFANDDMTIVNFEGTLTDSTNIVSKAYNFKGPTEYAKILTAGNIEAVTLENNHTMDFGTQGLSDTTHALYDEGIVFFRDGVAAVYEANGIKIGLLGYRGWVDTNRMQSEIAYMKSMYPIVIVSFHWGLEKVYSPTTEQIRAGRAAIDAGADLVLAHHPHVLQPIEQYQGKYIVYSLANFCFGGNSNPPDKDTIVFQEKFFLNDANEIVDTDMRIIPCYSTGSGHKFQPTPCDEAGTKRIIQKILNVSAKMTYGVKELSTEWSKTQDETQNPES